MTETFIAETFTDFLLAPRQLAILGHLFAAVLAGGLIGLERSFHGRPAGFRTHTLVCTASSLLMMIALYQQVWMPGATGDTIRTDPTRMAQGIMTGIGFLGAGVIYKEGFSVRGLTTAASIWVTAAIGILLGIGFYFPAVVATILTLSVLTFFRRIEARMPSQSYAHLHVSFPRDHPMTEDDLRKLLAEHHFIITTMSYRVVNEGRNFEYRTIIRTSRPHDTGVLAESLRRNPNVHELRISPSGD